MSKLNQRMIPVVDAYGTVIHNLLAEEYDTVGAVFSGPELHSRVFVYYRGKRGFSEGAFVEVEAKRFSK